MLCKEEQDDAGNLLAARYELAAGILYHMPMVRGGSKDREQGYSARVQLKEQSRLEQCCCWSRAKTQDV